MTLLCKHCALPAEDHHEFEAQMPDGCVCSPGDWYDEVTPICGTFFANEKEPDICATCEHERACHKAAA